jgi:hypothetical protein
VQVLAPESLRAAVRQRLAAALAAYDAPATGRANPAGR